MSAKQDYVALDWVKGEIESTLKQAQKSLEGFTRDRNDSTKMRFCLTYLHQIYRTLQIVEFRGASLLAEEMEKLAQVLLSNSTLDESTALEILMQSIIQMPLYLERVKVSKRDLPLVVLPLINQIRKARGEGSLSESEIAFTGLDTAHQTVDEESTEPHSEPGADELPPLLKKIRQLFQFALVGLVRNKDVDTNIQYLAKALVRLERLSSGPQRTLWWIAEALIEGIKEKSIELTAPVKKILGAVDGYIKELADAGSLDVGHDVPEKLVKALLYEIGKSHADTPHIIAVREKFDLDELLPEKEIIDKERVLLKGPSRDAISSVIGALLQEFQEVKALLDGFVSEDVSHGEQLRPLLAPLKKIAKSLHMLDLKRQAQTVVKQVKAIQQLIENNSEFSEGAIMDVAGSLLYLEADLIGISDAFNEDKKALESEGDETVAPTTVGKAKIAAIREARNELEIAKEAILEFIASQWDRSYLYDAPKQIERVIGSTNMLKLQKATAILESCHRYLTDELINGNATPSWRTMDTLADAITSVDYYLERLTENGDKDDTILEVAVGSLASLGYPVRDFDDIINVVNGLDGGGKQPQLGDVEETEEAETSDAEVSSNVEVDETAQITDEQDNIDEQRDVEKALLAEMESDDEFTAQDEKDDDQTQSLDVSDTQEESEASEENEVESEPESAEESEVAGVGDQAVEVSESESENTVEHDSAVQENEPVAEQDSSEQEEEEDFIDDELIEIFVEEAGEVLDNVKGFFPRWKKSPNDQESLVELRRAYHTLKGSGRMVGANIVGELAWSIENLLNRVLDKSVALLPVIFDLVEAVNDVVPELVEHFSNRTKPSFVTTALEEFADALSKGQPPGDLSEAIAQTKGTPAAVPKLEASTDEVVETAGQESVEQGVEEQLAEYGEDANTTDAQIAVEDEPEEQQAIVEEDDLEQPIDPVLIYIFKKEAGSHVEAIQEFLSAPFDAVKSITKEVLRALHTLKGSAHMAGVTPIAQLVTPAEQFVRELYANSEGIDVELHNLLTRLVEVVSNGLEMPSGGATGEITGYAELFEVLSEKLEEIKAAFADEEEDEKASAERSLIVLLLEEVVDIVADSEELLSDWKEKPLTDKAISQLAEDMNVLGGSAESAKLSDVQKLCEVMESCYRAIDGKLFEPSDDFFETASRAHTSLMDTMDCLAIGQTPASTADLVGELEEYLFSAEPVTGKDSEEAIESVELEMLSNDNEVARADALEGTVQADSVEAIETEMPESDSSVSAPTEESLFRLEEDDDDDSLEELLEIFFEEAEDLVESSSNALEQWFDAPSDTSIVEGLQRDLHTLKGSARMSGITPIGDVAHPMENIYEGICQGRYKFSPGLKSLLTDCHDRISLMVDSFKSDSECYTANDLLLRLAQYQESPDQIDATDEPVKADVVESSPVGEVEEIDYSHGASQVDDVPHVEAIETELPESEISSGASAATEESQDSGNVVHANFAAPVEETLFKLEEDDGDDSLEELLEIFFEEAEDLVESSGNALDRWFDEPSDTSIVEGLQRDLHTLKGSARMSGITPIGDVAHHMENIYEGICQGRYTISPGLKSLLTDCHDRISHMVDGFKTNSECYTANDLLQELAKYQESPATYARTEVRAVEALKLPYVQAKVIESEQEPEPQSQPQLEIPTALTQPHVEAEIDPALEQELAGMKEKLQVLFDGEAEDIDLEMVDIFLDEADELLNAMDECIGQWRVNLKKSQFNDELQRNLHTLKGGARVAGLKKLGDMSHHFEHFLVESNDNDLVSQDGFVEKLLGRHDELLKHVEKVRESVTEFAQLQEKIEGSKGATQAAKHIKEITEKTSKAAAQSLKESKRGTQESIKVPASLLENLVNLAGETSITRGRIEQEINDFAHILDEMNATISRLRDQLRRLDLETEAQILFSHEKEGTYDADFDPLEMDRYSVLNQLSRSLGETAFDVLDLKNSLLDKTRDAETLLVQQARINTELHEGLMKTRMVPFSRMTPRLRRIVRQISMETNKEAELEVVNAEGELDRTILERMVSPLEHMLRNSVDHGLEMPDVREANNKPREGRITLHLAREGGEVVIRLSDDGAGINIEKVKQKAIEKGMMAPDANLTENEIYQFLFKSGFSTASAVTQISGRGVGMDVVYSEIKQMGGSMKIHSAQGVGTQFTIRLPFTVSVNRALMVKVADDAYAIPLTHIEGIVRVDPFELASFYENPNVPFQYAGQEYRIQYLGYYVHGVKVPNVRNSPRPLPVMLVRGGDDSIALQVDSLIGSREVVVKGVGPQLSSVSGISGATILGDGSVVIILDLLALIRAERAGHAITETQADVIDNKKAETVVTAPSRTTPLVMVVDDSVTVRKVSTRLLERHGMDVITAKDGVDAMTQLHETKPDVMLLDIEMPRMDGFEVATQVRHDPNLKDLAIIMITSRGGEKHKNRAFEIGVNRYMGKPFQESELLENIQALMSPEMAQLIT